jgi:hypothetical protein
MKSIFDRSFHYTRSVETDLRRTFAKARRKLREEQVASALNEAEIRAKVSPIKQNKNTAN